MGVLFAGCVMHENARITVQKFEALVRKQTAALFYMLWINMPGVYEMPMVHKVSFVNFEQFAACIFSFWQL